MALTRPFGLVSVAAAVCGCASTQIDSPPSLVNDPASGGTQPTYQLSAKEMGYGCSKLTGLIQVRVLQIRGYGPDHRGSLAARSVQSVATPIFGGTTMGLDPDGQYAKDVAMLQAYNRQLAAKGCKTFDLAAELKRTGVSQTPTPMGANKTR